MQHIPAELKSQLQTFLAALYQFVTVQPYTVVYSSMIIIGNQPEVDGSTTNCLLIPIRPSFKI